LCTQTRHELLDQVLHGDLVLLRQVARSREEQLSDGSGGFSEGIALSTELARRMVQISSGIFGDHRVAVTDGRLDLGLHFRRPGVEVLVLAYSDVW
jgi:hypothetical protein